MTNSAGLKNTLIRVMLRILIGDIEFIYIFCFGYRLAPDALLLSYMLLALYYHNSEEEENRSIKGYFSQIGYLNWKDPFSGLLLFCLMLLLLLDSFLVKQIFGFIHRIAYIDLLYFVNRSVCENPSCLSLFRCVCNTRNMWTT